MYSLARYARCAPPGFSRRLATAVSNKRKPKEEGSIAAIFTTLTPGGEQAALPDRFAALKKDIFKEELVETWRQVLSELESTVGEIIDKGNGVGKDLEILQVLC